VTKGGGFYISPVAFQISTYPSFPQIAASPLLAGPVPDAPLPDERLLSDAPPFFDAPLLPDVTPLPDTCASPSPTACELGRADVHHLLTRKSQTRRPSPTHISSPTRRPLPAVAPTAPAPASPRPSSSMSADTVARELDFGTCRTVPTG
jgi:hypothetical protein